TSAPLSASSDCISVKRPMTSSVGRMARKARIMNVASAAGARLLADQQRFLGAAPERVPADPIEGDLRGEEPNPVACAPKLVAAGNQNPVRGEAYVDGADRGLGRATVGTRHAGDRDGEVGTKHPPRSGGHLLGGLVTHRPVTFERPAIDA